MASLRVFDLCSFLEGTDAIPSFFCLHKHSNIPSEPAHCKIQIGLNGKEWSRGEAAEDR